jgi:prepilin signal peptidase PulO-like enzyme (type II secretory pathway)
MQESKIYSIPNRFRQVENMHIVLWLIKDACWAMNFRTLGTIMIVPTLAVAILITWQTRHIHSELLHNLVVTLWITANCTWMIGEFFGWDEHLLGDYGLRQLTIIPFTIGLLILLYYYVFLARNVSYQEKMNIRTNETIEQELNR